MKIFESLTANPFFQDAIKQPIVMLEVLSSPEPKISSSAQPEKSNPVHRVSS
jgi:hypothetical protein